jgi:Nucleotidyl transferase AbiEii toxin, Type IV TA system
MSDPNQPEPRDPTLRDLTDMCRELNQRGAKYIIIGGMAMMEHGMPRFTEDIDLLYETSRANQLKIREVLSRLPQQAILEIDESEDMAAIGTIRVNDDITVDLMPAACGVDYEAAQQRVTMREREGVLIPYADAELLLDTKKTWREKDQIDSAYLRAKIAREKSGQGGA